MNVKSTCLVLAVWVTAVNGSLSCAASEIGEQRRAANEVRAVDHGEQWPLTVDRAVLSCKVIAGRPMATAKTFDGREFALNGAAKGRGGFAPIDPVWKTRVLGTPKDVVTRVPATDRRRIFAGIVRCEDDAMKKAESETSDIRKQVERERALSAQCKAALQKREKVTEAEGKLIGEEGALLSWPPLQPTRVSLSPLIDAALKLCK